MSTILTQTLTAHAIEEIYAGKPWTVDCTCGHNSTVDQHPAHVASMLQQTFTITPKSGRGNNMK